MKEFHFSNLFKILPVAQSPIVPAWRANKPALAAANVPGSVVGPARVKSWIQVEIKVKNEQLISIYKSIVQINRYILINTE